MTSVINDLPESLRIGFVEWKVEIVPKGSLKSADGAECLGVCESEFFTIKIADEQIDTNAKNTFLHELFHAIYIVHGLPDTVDEETAVASLTNGLQAALQDNVDLQVWWVNHMCGDIEYA